MPAAPHRPHPDDGGTPATADPSGARVDVPTRTRSDTVAALVLAGVIVAWIATFGVLVVLRQHRFASFDFDMGIHDQSIWLLAHGRGFVTVRGLHVFGHHATPGYLLLVPLAWLGAGPHVWNLLQVTTLALGAVPVFLLARHRTTSAWMGAALGGAFLLHPSAGFFAWELFHPEVVAITPLLAAYYCATRRSWGWFALFAGLAVAWKEDVALVVVVLGALIALRGDRRVGMWTTALALAWFSVWTFGVFPLLNDGAVQSRHLYADVGGSPWGIVRTAFEDPGRIAGRLTSSDAGDFAWHFGAPYAFLPLLAPGVLLLAAPQLFLNLLTNVPWTKTITFHYAALPLAGATLALVEAIGWIARRTTGRVVAQLVVTVVLVASTITAVEWGLSPLGEEYRHGWWPLTADSRLDTVRRQLRRIPDGAAVTATYNLVPHLSRRAEIYSFPNPWVSRNFGIDGSPTRSPARVQWLAVDRRLLGPADVEVLEGILRGGEFRVVADADDYVLARRVTTGGP